MEICALTLRPRDLCTDTHTLMYTLGSQSTSTPAKPSQQSTVAMLTPIFQETPISHQRLSNKTTKMGEYSESRRLVKIYLNTKRGIGQCRTYNTQAGTKGTNTALSVLESALDGVKITKPLGK